MRVVMLALQAPSLDGGLNCRPRPRHRTEAAPSAERVPEECAWELLHIVLACLRAHLWAPVLRVPKHEKGVKGFKERRENGEM